MRSKVIDMHVYPAFLESICRTDEQERYAREMYGLYKTDPIPEELLFCQMDCAGIDMAALLPLDLTTISGGVLAGNEDVCKLVERYPDKFIGFASIDPSDPQAHDKLEYAFMELKLSGLSLHPAKQRFYPADDKLDEIYRICEKWNKPVTFQSGMTIEPDTLSKYSRPVNFEELAYRHPELRICLAQFGWPWIQETCMLMLKYQNVYADTALLYFDSAPEFYEQVFTIDMGKHWIDRSQAQDNVWLCGPRLEMIRMKKALEKMDMRDSTLELLFGGNALEFIGQEVT